MRARAALGFVVASACLGPTEIELDLTTNVDCAKFNGARIGVGGNIIEAHDCASGELGTLVVIPGSANDPVVGIEIAEAVGVGLDVCVPPYMIDAGANAGCIVARRSLRYASHKPLHLPIALDSDCLNIMCSSTDTCVAGQCRPAAVDPNTCDLDGGCQLVDASTDAAVTTIAPKKITIGAAHACALMADKTLRCWGDNTFGQLGAASAGTFAASPVEVDTIHDAIDVSAGGNTTCAVRVNSDVWCWGDDSTGSVNAIISSTLIKSPMAAGLFGATHVSVANTYACALLVANDAGTATAQCWGTPPGWATGAGFRTPPSSLPNADRIACGSMSCLTSDAMAIAVFGEDENDNLDNPSSGGYSGRAVSQFYTPITDIGMGTDFGCVLGTTKGTVACWGKNDLGQLGGTPSTPHLDMVVSGVMNATAFAAGANHACAVVGGHPVCWGDNSNGVLGVGDVNAHIGPQTLSMSNVDAIAAGNAATCAKQGSVVTCWGSVSVLGDGSSGSPLRTAPGAPVAF